MSNPIPPSPSPSRVLLPASERRADLLDRQLQIEPVDGLDRQDLVGRVKAEGLQPLGSALDRVESGFASRERRAKVFGTVGGGIMFAGSTAAFTGWLAGAVVGGMRFGFWGAAGGLLGGAVGGFLVGMGLGVVGNKIYQFGKAPKEAEKTAVEHLRQVQRRLEAPPARSAQQVEAARQAAEQAAARVRPQPSTPEPARPDTDTINGALFGAQGMRAEASFDLPTGAAMGTRCSAGGGVPTRANGHVGMVDPRTGQETWSRELPGLHGDHVLSPDGTRLALGGTGRVLVVDAATGQDVASWEDGQHALTPAFDARGRLLVTGWNGSGVALLEAGRPEPIWISRGSSYDDKLAACADGMVYQSGWNVPARAIDGETGTEKWTGPVRPWLSGAPAVAPDGTLVARDNEGNVAAVDPDYGLRLWKATPGKDVGDPIVSADGRSVVVGHDGNRLSSLDLADGSPRWTARLEGERTVGPLVSPQGDLLVGDGTGRVYRFDPDRGVATRLGKVEGAVRGLAALPDGDLLVMEDSRRAHRLTEREEPQQAPGRIEQEEEFVLIGGVKVPVKR